MAQKTQDPTIERIEIVDQPEEMAHETRKKKNFLPLILVAASAIVAFVLLQRRSGK